MYKIKHLRWKQVAQPSQWDALAGGRRDHASNIRETYIQAALKYSALIFHCRDYLKNKMQLAPANIFYTQDHFSFYKMQTPR